MHYAISTKVQGQTREMCPNIYDQTFLIFHFLCVFEFLHTQNKNIKVRSNAKTIKTMHIKRCMMHKCMTMKHLMHEGSNKD